MKSLKGQAALVTGASGGIGAATALALADAGAHVGIAFRSNRAGAEAAKKGVEERGSLAILLEGDAADFATAHVHAQAVYNEFGRLDILINNAAIWNHLETGAGSEEIWDRLMAVNLKSVFNYTEAVVPTMRKIGQGSIVNISSTAGQRGEAFHGHYAASKGGIISYTKSLAVELAPEIRVNAVAPGWVDTPLNKEVFADKKFRARIEQEIPLKRIPPPEDIAGPIVFLVSGMARHITGEVLNVNGGAVLCG